MEYVSFVRKLKLIAQIIETVVHRRCSEHQYLRFYACANHLAHQLNKQKDERTQAKDKGSLPYPIRRNQISDWIG